MPSKVIKEGTWRFRGILTCPIYRRGFAIKQTFHQMLVSFDRAVCLQSRTDKLTTKRVKTGSELLNENLKGDFVYEATSTVSFNIKHVLTLCKVNSVGSTGSLSGDGDELKGGSRLNTVESALFSVSRKSSGIHD